MAAATEAHFKKNYQTHLQYLTLKGLPQATHQVLQRFWQVHRNPVLLFPNRHGGAKGAARAMTPMDRGGVQTTLKQVVAACGLKKCLARGQTLHYTS